MTCKNLLNALHGSIPVIIKEDTVTHNGFLAMGCVWNLNPESFEDFIVSEINLTLMDEFGVPTLEILVIYGGLNNEEI